MIAIELTDEMLNDMFLTGINLSTGIQPNLNFE